MMSAFHYHRIERVHAFAVVRVSVKSEDGCQDLENVLKDKVSIVVGQSGVGKSSVSFLLHRFCSEREWGSVVGAGLS